MHYYIKEIQRAAGRKNKESGAWELYPMDRRRNGGVKPRNMEVSRDKRLFSENSGSTIEKPKEETVNVIQHRILILNASSAINSEVNKNEKMVHKNASSHP